MYNEEQAEPGHDEALSGRDRWDMACDGVKITGESYMLDWSRRGLVLGAWPDGRCCRVAALAEATAGDGSRLETGRNSNLLKIINHCCYQL